MAKVDLPHSLVRKPRDFPTPPRVYNPWDDFVPQEDPLGDDVELDYDGQEVQGGSDDEEEEQSDDEETESENDGDGDGDEDGDDDE